MTWQSKSKRLISQTENIYRSHRESQYHLREQMEPMGAANNKLAS